LGNRGFARHRSFNLCYCVSSFSLIDSFQNFSNNASDLTPNSENYFLETEGTSEIQENNLNQPGAEMKILTVKLKKNKNPK
jgi:hypothetical protein